MAAVYVSRSLVLTAIFTSSKNRQRSAQILCFLFLMPKHLKTVGFVETQLD